jgi:hypothetical protein
VPDVPDWTEAVEVTGGSTGGYASLTGPGQTTTPGDLTQAGGLTVSDPGTTGLQVFVPEAEIHSFGTMTIETAGADPILLSAGGLVSDDGSHIKLAPDSAGFPNQIVFTSFNTNAGAGVLDITGNTQSVPGGAWATTLFQVDGFEVLTPAPGSTNSAGFIAFGDFYPAGSGGIQFETLSSFFVGMGQTFQVQAIVTTPHTLRVVDDSQPNPGVTIAGNTSQKVGFYGVTPKAQITVTGSRGGNAALTSLLSALGSLGIIQDSTTP